MPPRRGLLVRLYPELALCRSDFERSEVLGRVRAAKPNRWIPVLAASGVVGLSIAAIVVLRYALNLGQWLGPAIVASVLTISFVAAVMLGLIERGPARRTIRDYLRSRGIRICLGCGYDCRGTESTVCPECGRAIETP